MLRLAITGGIACGKTTVGRLMSSEGIPVFDADIAAHELLSAPSAWCGRIVESFGAQVLGKDGAVDRDKLGPIVFADDQKLKLLNEILHPEIKRKWETWLSSLEGSVLLAAVIVPLLFEAEMSAGWDAILCVAASRETQIARLKQRGVEGVAAQQRLRVQMDIDRKMQLADFVIWNEDSESMLAVQVSRVLKRVMEKE